VGWILERGVSAIREHELTLCELFLERTGGVEHLTVYGPRDPVLRAGVFSVRIDGTTPGELAAALEKDFGICTRPGVHCAPLAHKTIGTHPAGTCRLSFSPFTTEGDVAFAADALLKIAQRVAVGR
jgi:cysteine desulfurase/selenocysteine lyase